MNEKSLPSSAKQPKVTFEFGKIVVEQFDCHGTVATFVGEGAGSAGKQFVDWLKHTPGTELEDLRVAVNAIDSALCNYCNEASDPYDPPSSWDKSCEYAFKRLCEAYNDWHKNGPIIGELSQKFWGQFESELYETKNKLRDAELKLAKLSKKPS